MHARLELSLNNINMSTPPLLKLREDLRRQLEAVKSDERFYKKEIGSLRAAIDLGLLDFLKQDRVEKSESDILHQQITINRKLAQDLDEVYTGCAQACRDLEQGRMEQDYKDRELIRAKNKLRTLKNDWAIELLAIEDASKRSIETQTRLKDFQALYEHVKNERNKYVARYNLDKSDAIIVSASF